MMDTAGTLERRRAQSIAEEYRKGGYEVTEQPAQQQLPPFLADYHPDLLVRKAAETVVVEVKSRKSLAREPQVAELAGLLRSKPGWSFELVLVDTGEEIEAPHDARPFTREDVAWGNSVAERLLEAEFAEAALMQAWASAEAAVRLLIEEEGESPERRTPCNTLKWAAMNGVISREDYRFLTGLLRLRNAYAHGFTLPNTNSKAARDLVETTRRLLQ